MRIVIRDSKKEVKSDNHKHEHEAENGDDCPFEPEFAVLEVETHLEHVSQQLAVMREFFTYTGTCGASEGVVSQQEGENGAERKVCNGIVTVEPDMRRFTLEDTMKAYSTH